MQPVRVFVAHRVPGSSSCNCNAGKQLPKNPVDSPGAGEGGAFLFDRNERLPGQPPLLTHTLTHSHTHARRNTHVPASCRYTRSTSATLQSCTRVFVHQPLAASSWVAQHFVAPGTRLLSSKLYRGRGGGMAMPSNRHPGPRRTLFVCLSVCLSVRNY